VGQSEIEIAGLANLTAVVLVPEAGDEIQTMKAGLMEIADVFIVNKADRPDADMFVKNLRMMLAPAFHNHEQEIKIIKTIATKKEGINEFIKTIYEVQRTKYDIENREHSNLKLQTSNKRDWLLTEKAYQIIQQNRMKNINKHLLKEELELAAQKLDFNLYQYIKKYL
jgi:LAO/AO transport system kinase